LVLPISLYLPNNHLAQLADILNFSSTTDSFLDDAAGLYAHPFYWISPILLARLELLNPFVVS